MAKKAPKKTATTKTAAKKTTSKKEAESKDAPAVLEPAAEEKEPAAEETSIQLRKFKSSWQPETIYKVEDKKSSGSIPDAPPFTDDENAKKLLLLKFDISTFPKELTPENKKKQEEALKRIAEENEKRKAELEALKKAEEETRIKAEEEARKKAEEEARIKAEEEARIKAEEEARIKAEEEARKKAEEEARIKAEEEARKKAEEEARIKAEEEARKKAEEEARIKAEEEARKKAEEEARIKAEEEARKKAKEEARLAAESKAVEIARDEARKRFEAAEKTAPKKPLFQTKKESGISPGLVTAGAIFALLMTALFFKSAINSTKYYVKDTGEGIQIWKGDFSPKGTSMLADLEGAKKPEKIEDCYSKAGVAPMIFSYYIGLAEKQLKIQEIKLARANADRALEYAIDNVSMKAAKKCISQVDFMELLEKADLRIAEASQKSIHEAITMMAKAPKFDLDDAQLVILENKINVAKAQLAELKRMSSSKIMPSPSKKQSKPAEEKTKESKENPKAADKKAEAKPENHTEQPKAAH